jgi:hypothetical protein
MGDTPDTSRVRPLGSNAAYHRAARKRNGAASRGDMRNKWEVYATRLALRTGAARIGSRPGVAARYDGRGSEATASSPDGPWSTLRVVLSPWPTRHLLSCCRRPLAPRWPASPDLPGGASASCLHGMSVNTAIRGVTRVPLSGRQGEWGFRGSYGSCAGRCDSESFSSPQGRKS